MHTFKVTLRNALFRVIKGSWRFLERCVHQGVSSAIAMIGAVSFVRNHSVILVSVVVMRISRISSPSDVNVINIVIVVTLSLNGSLLFSFKSNNVQPTRLVK